ncbi:MAG: alpha/beta fold hydrolase [Rhodospirillales bacterium]|nr:alpha/beta fold hydrolase [Rhodospirillales bacterium]
MDRPPVTPAVYATGAGTPLVLLHGVGTDHRAFRPQLIRLAAHHRVLAWDMPGYGCSPHLDPLDWPSLADALARLLDAQGIDRAHILGHSIGGMVAQAFCARHPARTRSLVLSATSPAFGRPDGDWQREFVRQRLAPLETGKTMADLAEATVESLVGPAASKAVREFARGCVAQVPVQAFAAAIRLIVTFDGRPDLPKIACPTLLLAGERDTNAPAAMMQKMAERIAGSKFVVLPGCGHLANIEDPDAFNAAVLEFLRETETHHA